MKKIYLLFLCSFLSLQSNDGDLDTSFGSAGISTEGSDAHAYAGITQPDGKIVVGGGLVPMSFALSRYGPNGSIDSAFGINGTVTTDIGGGIQVITAVLLQKDGKIVALGTATNDFQFALARYNPDGSLDTSFGTNGTIITNITGGAADILNTGLLQPDGKIIAAGHSNVDFALVRYNQDGSQDASFGTSGIVKTDLGGTDKILAIALQPDGKIIVGGRAAGGYRIVRYLSNGSLDTSFGSSGIVISSINFVQEPLEYGQGGALLLRSDGKFYAAGADSSGTFFAVALYNKNGSLDESFGVDGIVIGSTLGGQGFSAALQPDGKIVIGGASTFALTLNRFTSAGSLDVSFGTNGVVSTSVTATNSACQVMVQADGKLVVAAGNDFTLVRYLIPSITVSSFARDLRAKFDLIQKTSG